MMSVALFFLISAAGTGGLFLVLWAALANHPTPSQSGMVPVAFFCLWACPIGLVAALVSWIVAVLF